ncbi:MAG: hypothetical protein HGB26_05170 [Desulfobulbaceae bacterium]|nr:hypothetical protein [Desulfobulbaceae bacterium]
MIKLDRPSQQPGEVFTTCINRVRDIHLKNRLEGALQAVIDASTEFDNAASHTRLHQIIPQTMVGGLVTQLEMESVYTQRMAKKDAPGRDIYDQLINSAPQGKCPLCAHRQVSTLDHHLPKALYPALSVTPLNLVPACGDCNKAKLTTAPITSADETLHPYYDDIDSDLWLAAEIVQTRPAAVRFFIEAPSSWSVELKLRVEKHFSTFGLAKLYSLEAADELNNIRYELKMLFGRGGADLVKTHLCDRAESCYYARRNGWRTASYNAFSNSDWFCNGGFRE